MVGTIENTASTVASRLGIDLRADTKTHPNLTPRIAKLDENGTTERHMSGSGTNYTFMQIDYMEGNKVWKSRMIAIILPGNRTEIAYWTKKAPLVTLDVHRGKGTLIVGDPEQNLPRTISIDSKNTKEVNLPPGCFYTVRSAEDGIEPLVISGLYDADFNWDMAEIALTPDQGVIETPEGKIEVPPSFSSVIN